MPRRGIAPPRCEPCSPQASEQRRLPRGRCWFEPVASIAFRRLSSPSGSASGPVTWRRISGGPADSPGLPRGAPAVPVPFQGHYCPGQLVNGYCRTRDIPKEATAYKRGTTLAAHIVGVCFHAARQMAGTGAAALLPAVEHAFAQLEHLHQLAEHTSAGHPASRRPEAGLLQAAMTAPGDGVLGRIPGPPARGPAVTRCCSSTRYICRSPSARRPRWRTPPMRPY